MRLFSTQLEFTLEIQEALNYECFLQTIPLIRRRMEVLWLKRKELSHNQKVELGGVSGNTMGEYFRLYKEGVIEKFVECYYP